MRTHRVDVEVHGPWSLATSRRFWEGFSPNRLSDQSDSGPLTATFLVDSDWSRAETTVEQRGPSAEIEVSGTGDLEAAAAQVQRFLSLDVDGRDWPAVGERDPVVAAAQKALPGLRPCGFYSPYEAAVWTVLSQRVRITQAAKLQRELTANHGEGGAFPSPHALLALDLDLPWRKPEYVRAVAEAALDGALEGAALRAMPAGEAVARVRAIKGLGVFASELVVIRGANAPDVVPTTERRLEAEITHRYGPGAVLADVAEAWRPFRTWAAVHLRSLREERTHEIGGEPRGVRTVGARPTQLRRWLRQLRSVPVEVMSALTCPERSGTAASMPSSRPLA